MVFSVLAIGLPDWLGGDISLTALVVAALVVLAAYLWIIEFAQLMALADGDFPGRHDKALWVAAFVFTFFLAALAFVVWKKTMLAMRTEQRR